MTQIIYIGHNQSICQRVGGFVIAIWDTQTKQWITCPDQRADQSIIDRFYGDFDDDKPISFVQFPFEYIDNFSTQIK